MTEAEIRALVNSTATKTSHVTIVETFKLFGVDLDDTHSVNAFRVDLISIRRFRLFLNWALTITGAAMLISIFNWIRLHV